MALQSETDTTASVGGFVLAEDFGYQLSPKPAKAMTPRIEEEVDKALEDAAAKVATSKS
jgi:hypothetical protein